MHRAVQQRPAADQEVHREARRRGPAGSARGRSRRSAVPTSSRGSSYPRIVAASALTARIRLVASAAIRPVRGPGDDRRVPPVGHVRRLPAASAGARHGSGPPPGPGRAPGGRSTGGTPAPRAGSVGSAPAPRGTGRAPPRSPGRASAKCAHRRRRGTGSRARRGGHVRLDGVVHQRIVGHRHPAVGHVLLEHRDRVRRVGVHLDRVRRPRRRGWPAGTRAAAPRRAPARRRAAAAACCAARPPRRRGDRPHRRSGRRASTTASSAVRSGPEIRNHTILPSAAPVTPQSSTMDSSISSPRPVPAVAAYRRRDGRCGLPSPTSTRRPSSSEHGGTSMSVPACSSAFVTISLTSSTAASARSSRPVARSSPRIIARASATLAGCGGSRASNEPCSATLDVRSTTRAVSPWMGVESRFWVPCRSSAQTGVAHAA